MQVCLIFCSCLVLLLSVLSLLQCLQWLSSATHTRAVHAPALCRTSDCTRLCVQVCSKAVAHACAQALCPSLPVSCRRTLLGVTVVAACLHTFSFSLPFWLFMEKGR